MDKRKCDLRVAACSVLTAENSSASKLCSDEVHEVGGVRRDAALVPCFEELSLEVGRQRLQHPAAFSPVLRCQVAKGQAVTKVVRVNSPNAIVGCFLLS